MLSDIRAAAGDFIMFVIEMLQLTAFTSLVALIAPRTAGLNELVASM